MLRVEAGELCRRFAHHDARHQWHTGHVTANPKLVLGDVFVAQTDALLTIDHHDRGKLFHLVALGIVFPNFVDVGVDLIQINCFQINDQILAA